MAPNTTNLSWHRPRDPFEKSIQLGRDSVVAEPTSPSFADVVGSVPPTGSSTALVRGICR